MKQRIINSVLFLAAFIFQMHADAHSGTNIRKNCYGDIRPRYIAETAITYRPVRGYYKHDRRWRCSGTAESTSTHNSGSIAVMAIARRGSSTDYKYTSSNSVLYTAGNDVNMLFHKNLMPNEDEGHTSAEISSDVTFVDMEGANNDIHATTFTGALVVKNTGLADFYSTYEIIAWMPASDTDPDEAITADKIAWKSSITLTSDGVTGTGIFQSPNSYVISTSEDGTTTVSFNMPNGFTADLPDGVAMEIYSFAHSGVRNDENPLMITHNEQEDKAAEGVLLNSYNLEQFEVYPVPSGAETKIDFATKENDHVTIEIYDYSGKKIKTVFDNDVDGNTKQAIEFKPDADLKRGQYQVLVKVGKRIFTRAILVQ